MLDPCMIPEVRGWPTFPPAGGVVEGWVDRANRSTSPRNGLPGTPPQKWCKCPACTLGIYRLFARADARAIISHNTVSI